MPKKIALCIFSLFSSLFVAQVYADNPNLYVCKGQNVSLTYRTFSFGPVTPDTIFLNLTIGTKTYTAGKSNIQSQKTIIGDIKTTTLKFIPDVSIKDASFVLPQINLGQNFQGTFVDKVGFKSQLVLTTIATPFIATPYIGIVNRSNYIDLNCTASLVLIPL